MLNNFHLKGKSIIADKGYDSLKPERFLLKEEAVVVIPSRKTARVGREINKTLYNRRHLIENLFQKLKNSRRFATRYEKSASFFLAVALLAAVFVCLSF